MKIFTTDGLLSIESIECGSIVTTMRKVEPMISHMASYCCRYRLKMFCYDGIGAITIYAYTQKVFDEIPGTCKYNTTSNCVTLLR